MSRRQKIWLILVFVAVLLGALVVTMPLRQVLRVVKIPPALQIAGLSGSVSHAHIKQIRYQQFSLSDVKLSDVNLSWHPLCLLQASICYRLTSGDDVALDAIGRINLLTRNLSVEPGHIHLDSRMLAGMKSLLVKPRGVFELNIEQLTLVDQKLQDLAGQIVWLDAGIVGEEQTLGNYIADIKTSEQGIAATLSDQKGLLKLQGEALLQWSGDYSLDIKLQARSGLKPSIKHSLELIAKRTGLNRYAIQHRGRLNPQQMRQLNTLH